MIDLNRVLLKGVSLYYWKAKEKKVNLFLKIGKKFPNKVEVDDGRLT